MKRGTRKNNIELVKVEGNNKNFQIICWQKNQYYGNESSFEKDGDYYQANFWDFRIHKSCFENPESCYVICFIKDGIVEFVGDRPIELETIEEMRDFLFLLRSGISKSLRYKIPKD